MYIQLKILIKEKRNEQHLSIRELEKLSGVSRNYISEIERELSIPSVLILCKLAKAMKISASELFWYK